jgi:transaldolase
LIGEYTINTMPPAPMAAFKDHGHAEPRLIQNFDEALNVLNRVQALRIDYVELTETLQREGVTAFAQAFANLLYDLEAKIQKSISEPTNTLLQK